MDGVRLSINIHGLREEDNRDGKMCRNVMLSEGKTMFRGEPLDE